MFGNINDIVLDEIALEGLDGITLEGLWNRLADRLKIPLPFTEKIKNRFWEVVRHLKPINIYEIPDPRPFFIFDRYSHVEPDLGIVIDPDEIPLNIYPYYPIKDNYIQGSCKHFETRIDRTNEIRQLTAEETELRYPKKAVIVASQEVRYNTLVGNNYQLTLTPIQYCILERIGRSRYAGEITIGKVSLQDIGESAKSLFYHRKTLLKYQLIIKQPYQQKLGFTNNSGCLLHLPRFYIERKPKAILVIEEVVEILRQKPNCIASYDDIKSHFVDNIGFKKIWKTTEFQRIIKTDVKMKYKELYPNSDQNLWICKNGIEKIVRCFKLMDPNIDVNEVWMKEEIEDDDEHGLLNNKNTPLDMPMMMYALKLITDSGSTGITQNELSTKLGQNRLNARAICRNLVRKKCVAFFMDNIGRQRVTKFMSKHFVKDSQIQRVFSEHNILKANKADKESSIKENVKRKRDSDTVDDEPPIKRQDVSIKEELNQSLSSCPDEEIPSTSSDVAKLKQCLPMTSTDAHAITTLIEPTTKVPGMKIYNTFSLEQGRTWGGKAESGATVTYRFLKRMNLLIKVVKEHKVVSDLTKLMKRINEDEEKEGDFTKIDKKTLYRLMLKVQEEGHVKLWRITLRSDVKEKVMIYICEPNIQSDDPILKSEIERTKMKEFIAKFKEEKIINHSLYENEMCNNKDQNEHMKSIYRRTSGKEYGYQPRFERMRLLHQILYYLIYEQKEDNVVYTKDEAIVMWKDNNCNYVDDDELYEELPEQIYSSKICWKMFIPPLPHLRDWPKGWAMVCDVIFRIPINIFVKLVCVPYALPELKEILRHPIKKYYLLSQFTSQLRSCLVYKRRYIFAIYQIILQLCFIGTIQFGPQRFKEKDQQLIYLNTKALIWDTRTSERGYNVISEQDYSVHTFEFTNFEAVEKFWYELWNTCVHTYLGMRTNLSAGNDIIIVEHPDTKPILLSHTEPRTTAEEVINRDIGYIPGDNRGAGGLDSSLFAHVRRNWNWPSETNVKKVNRNVNSLSHTIKRKRLNYTDLSIKRTVARKKVIQKVKKSTNKELKSCVTNVRKKSSRIKITSIVHKRTNRKPFYDDIDKEALKYMDKLRVDWSIEEDRVLLLCKVAFLYLSPKNKKHIIVFQHVRDCLHKLLNSRNKTSRACQRRINYVMKNPITQKSVALFLEELNQCTDIRNMFKNITKDKINIAFVVLLGILLKKFGTENSAKNLITLPDSLAEFQLKYDFYTPNLVKTDMSYTHPKEIIEIHSNVLQSTIHSTMCCTADKSNWSFQLFKVYQSYPDTLVRAVMTNMRRYQFISVKKNIPCHKKQFSKLPLTNVPFQLSQTYRHKLVTKHPFEIFTKSYSKICEFEENLIQLKRDQVEVVAMNGGDAASIFELYLYHDIHFHVKIPEHVIILDPNIKSKDDERYEKIFKRFQDIIKSVPLPFVENEDEEELIIPDKIVDNKGNLVTTSSSSATSTKTTLQSSRIAFYMARDDINDNIDDKTSTQHIHDFFVVNSSAIYMELNKMIDDDVDYSLQQINPDKCKQLLKYIQRSAVIPDEKPDLSTVSQTIIESGGNKMDVDFCNQLISFISEQNHLGASSKLLEKHFSNQSYGWFTLCELLDLLIECRIVYKMGVININYIHYNHIKNWVIKSFKLKRSDKDKMPKHCPYDLEDEQQTMDVVASSSGVNETNDTTNQIDEIDNNSEKKRCERIKITSNKTKKSNLNTYEEVTVNIAPWLRIDGSINRRILDRWLGAVLCYCIDTPGVLVERVTARFPFINPFQIKILLEYLEKLECIQLFKVLRSKVSLFSDELDTKIVSATGLENFDEIYVETTPTCVTKLGSFIGKKQYKTDFLTDDNF